jgi:hypothetical protein
MTYEEMYDLLLTDSIGLDEDMLDLAFAIGGRNKYTAERILFYYTGWRTFEDWLTNGKRAK